MGHKRRRDESTSDSESTSDDHLEEKLRRLKKKLKKQGRQKYRERRHRNRHDRSRHSRRRSSSLRNSDSENTSSSSGSSNSSSQSNASRQSNSSTHRRSKSPLKAVSPTQNLSGASEEVFSEKSLTEKSKEEGDEAQLSAELLQAIGKRYYEERAFAPPLHSEIAVRWKDVIQKGLPQEEKQELIKKYPIPENCVFSDPPKLNQEIKAVVSQAVVNRDARIILKQQKIATVLSAIAKIISIILKEGVKEDNVQILEHLSDSIKILADLQRDESVIRRSLIMANINSSLKDTLTNTRCEEFLFGEKLDEIIKSAKALENTVKDLRVTKSQGTGQSKNSNYPPRHQPKEPQKTSGGQRITKRYRSPNRQQQNSRRNEHRTRKDQGQYRNQQRKRR